MPYLKLSACIQPYIKLEGTVNYSPDDEVNLQCELQCETSANIPPSLPEIASRYNSPAAFVSHLAAHKPAPKEIEAVEELTRGQSDVPLWHTQRQGRITGSKVHRVVTRMRTVARDPETDVTNLVSSVMGYTQVDPSIPALKYGRLQEPHARESYLKMMNKNCTNFSYCDAGLIICEHMPILAASLDGLVSCSCHGKGLLEIKCPFSIVGQAPTPMNLKYLSSNDLGEVHLKKTSEYYSQIQLQLGVAREQSWCDFYVFTGDTSMAHYERIQFDAEYWTEICEASTLFMNNYLAPELVNPKLENLEDRLLLKTPITEAAEANMPQTRAAPPQRKTKAKKQKTRPTYICPLCDGMCKESDDIDEDTDENSVGCEKCRRWFHWGCIDFNEEEEEDEDWLCDDCME